MNKMLRVCLGFLLGTLSLSACTTPLQPVKPGMSHVENSTRGLIFGRIVIEGGCQKSFSSVGIDFGWWLTQVESGKRFVVERLTDAGPFVLNLPAGQYRVMRVMFKDKCGVIWDGKLPATFMAEPGAATYVGTWVIRFLHGGMGVQGKVIDQSSEAFRELGQTYTGNPKRVTVALLESAGEGYFGDENRRD